MTSRRRARVLVGACVALALGVGASSLAVAQPDGDAPLPALPDDYNPASASWNGLSRFVAVARGAGYDVRTASQLEWGDLDAGDLLVLIYPLRRADPERIDAFVQAGGHVLLADDFGEGSDAMARLRLIRGDVGASPRARRYHANLPYAPVATPMGSHPIGARLTEVVTNHPAVLAQVEGATAVIGFEDGQAVVAAGERGTGRFVVMSDPSMLINRMLQFPGNLQLVQNTLRWLDRGGRVKRVVLAIGDVPFAGEPRAYIDDVNAGPLTRNVAELNLWLARRGEWLWTPMTMRVLAAVLALGLVGLVITALPLRPATRADGRWLSAARPARRDAAAVLVASAEAGGDDCLPAACVLRDLTQAVLTRVTGRADPLFALSETELARVVAGKGGVDAGALAARIHRRCRGLPTRGQAAAAWMTVTLPRKEFTGLYGDVQALCRTLGEEL